MAKIIKDLTFSTLLDIYGALLTERQRLCLDLYYNEDESLAEIAEGQALTRQGVRDAIVKGERELSRLDAALGLRKLYQTLSKIADSPDTPEQIKAKIAQ